MIVYRDPDTFEMPSTYSIDMKLGEDGVRGDTSSEQGRRSDRELHCAVLFS